MDAITCPSSWIITYLADGPDEVPQYMCIALGSAVPHVPPVVLFSPMRVIVPAFWIKETMVGERSRAGHTSLLIMSISEPDQLPSNLKMAQTVGGLPMIVVAVA